MVFSTVYSLIADNIAIIFSTIDYLNDGILIMNVTHLLLTTVELAQADFVFNDVKSIHRVKLRIHSFEEVMYHTYYQLSHYGKGDISVLAAISDSLINAAQLAPLTAKK